MIDAGAGVSLDKDQSVHTEKSPPYTNIETKGMAIFSKGKLAAWLDGKEARGALWGLNKMKTRSSTLLAGTRKKRYRLRLSAQRPK